jgi:NHLM bacteriocin system ABC transporter ATP-binding protein
MLRVETAADAATQSAVWDRLLNLQVAFFRRFSTGDLQSRVTAVSQIRAYLGGTTARTLFSGVILLLNLALLLYYSPRLTLLAVAVAALSAAVTVVSGVMILRIARVILELKGRFFGFMVQLVNGVAKLRVAAAEERAFSRWARDYTQLLKLELRQRRIQDTVRAINIAVSMLSAILLFSFAAMLIRKTDGGAGLTTGVFLAFNVAYGTFIGAVTRLSNTVTAVLAIAILRERARPILEAVPEVGERKADPGRLRGRFELDHVSFRYRDDGPVILDDVSLRVDPGQFVALVGPSGSGKSTLFRLLLGFETPRSGSVFFDGQDLAGLDVHAVRRQLGVVLQNGRITSGSIFENIVTGTRLSLNDAWEAARAAGFAAEIEAMPMGMHTIISEGGTNLSGGQRQRLLLTRALVHRPKVLLLDEATSALDNKTQAIVSESLNRLDVTRVVIAHRLSTVRSADRIYVVEAGRVVEEGAFDELAAQQGLFARLMARQLA